MTVSIIIPVYNGERHICKCIDSIMRQTFADFEVIIVDDGSTDNTCNLLKNICVKYKDIFVFRQKNKGVSCARNSGIKYAKGKYLCFIDSDDYIEFDFLDRLIKNVEEGGCDWVLSGIKDFDKDEIVKVLNLPEKDYVLSDEEDCLQFFRLPLLTAPFAKLYRRDIIINNGLFFNEKIAYAEDREFNICYAQHVRIAKSLSYTGYYYRTDSVNSLSKKKRPYKFKYDLLYWNLLKDNFFQRRHRSNEVNSFLVNILYHCVNDDVKFLAESYSPKEMNHILSDVMPYVNKRYLRKYFSLIQANTIQKCLISYFPLIVLLKIYYYRYGKKN